MSAINRMIDAACGIPEGWKPPPRIAMECRACKRSKWVAGDATDPPGTALLVFTCQDCNPDDKTPVEFFDQNNQPLPHP